MIQSIILYSLEAGSYNCMAQKAIIYITHDVPKLKYYIAQRDIVLLNCI